MQNVRANRGHTVARPPFLILHLSFLIGGGLASRDGRDDADFVAVFERGLRALEETDVFLVHIDVHEPADFAFFVHEPLGDAGVAGLQFGDRLANGGGVDFDQLLVVGQLAERRWDSNFLWHKINYKFSISGFLEYTSINFNLGLRRKSPLFQYPTRRIERSYKLAPILFSLALTNTPQTACDFCRGNESLESSFDRIRGVNP